MTRGILHPDLDPKKIPKITMLPWNIWLFRFLMRLSPADENRPEGIESVIKRLNNQVYHIHRPVNRPSRHALLWMHGGGFIMGKPAQENALYFELADKLDITVIALTYRLAPQHPFPAPLDDCFASWQTVQRNPSEFGIDPVKVAIGGTSAGGGLCASLAQRIRDEGGTQPTAQVLVYPMLDDRTTMRSDIGMKDHYVWNKRSNITGWSAYLGAQRGAEMLPPYAAAARTKDLANLPPAWIGVGTIDIFHDEDIGYAQRLEAAGVPTTLNVVEGGYHGFNAVDPDSPATRAFMASIIGFLREQFAESSSPQIEQVKE